MCRYAAIALLYSRGGTLTQAVGECAAERVVAVEDAPGRLEHRVEEAVSSRAVPQRVQPTAQALRDLCAPVDDGLLILQLWSTHVQSLTTE